MDLSSRVDALPSTTFCGRRFSRQQIFQIADTVATYPRLSRHELALTLCEHLDWRTPGSKLKVNSALELLAKLESLEICKPPPILSALRRGPDRITPFITLAEPESVHSDLADLLPVSLKVVDHADGR